MNIDKAIQDVVEHIENNYRQKSPVTGISSGIPSLDITTNGFQKSEVTIVASRNTFDSTSLALSMVRHIALEKKQCCGYITMKTTIQKIITQLVANAGKIPYRYLINGRLSKEDFKSLADTASKIYNAPLSVLSEPNCTIDNLISKIKKMANDDGARIVFLDHISMTEPTYREKPLWEHFAEVSRKIKTLSIELDIPIVVISRLAKTPGSNLNPRLEDISYSDALGQDADSVLLLTGEISKPDWDKEREVSIITEKSHFGTRCAIPLTLFPSTMNIIEREK